MDGLTEYLFDTASKVAAAEKELLAQLKGSRFLLTGSSGLIGSQLTRVLLAANDAQGLGVQLILPARNEAKVKALFGDRPDIAFIQWELGQDVPELGSIDYFVHAACGTASKDFLQKPASTISSIVAGGEKTLKAALDAGVQRYLYLSTMEVYGEVEGIATEDNLGKLDPMVVRNSYPEAKRLVECLCSSYVTEFGLHASVLRLAQTFGQGVAREDARVFAEFGRCAQVGEDIVLLSDGSKRNPYLSVNDAARAILYCLLRGEAGVAYNAANEETFCSIKEMAQLVLREFGSSSATVRREFDAEREASFRKASVLQLDTSRLKALGWKPMDGLKEMYELMLQGWSFAE